MEKTKNYFEYFFSKLLSEKTKKKADIIFITISIVSFLLHLGFIFLIDINIVILQNSSSLLKNPIAAIYTPFSFILIYEVYLLVYYLPKSTTYYIAKQYEIITLIIIRRIFKDLTNLKFNDNWLAAKENILFGVDLLATLALFYLIFVFYKLNQVRENAKKGGVERTAEKTVGLLRFIDFKKGLAMFLIPIFVVLSFYSLGNWVYESLTMSEMMGNIKDINKIFFDEFFTILILVEVLILLVSFFLDDDFSNIIRNSGFIISTILIKLSFGTEGILNTFLILIAVLFGVSVLFIHNKYETLKVNNPSL